MQLTGVSMLLTRSERRPRIQALRRVVCYQPKPHIDRSSQAAKKGQRKCRKLIPNRVNVGTSSYNRFNNMREGRSSAHPPKPIVPAVRPLVGATGPGQSMALTSISISVASTARLPATTYPKPHTSVSAKASLHGRACKIVCENSRTSTRTMHSSVPDRRVPNKRYNQPPHSCCPTNERLDANGLLQQALARTSSLSRPFHGRAVSQSELAAPLRVNSAGRASDSAQL